MSTEYVILVDNKDQELGIEEKLAAHQQAKLHRAFSVFVVRRQANTWQILLQQRQLNKYHSAGLWTNTCCSHPRPGELLLTAAKRRLLEEIGLALELQEIACFRYKAAVGNGLIENEIDHVFIGFFEGEQIPFNTQEVAACSWIELDILKADLSKQPEKYTAWMAAALDLVIAHLTANSIYS